MNEQSKDTEHKNTASEQRPERRLLRSPSERMLWGVAGGLADYLRVDPTLVRLGFVVAAFFGGFGVLAYLVLAVVVPEDDGTGRPVAGRRPPTWALVLLAIVLLFALPGPFWGFDHGWWWGWVGPLWIGILIVAAVWAYRALRGGRPRPPGSGGPAARAETSEAETRQAPASGGTPPRVVKAIAIVVIVAAAIAGALSLAAVSAWATASGHGAAVAGIVIALGVALGAIAFLGEERRAIAPWLLVVALALAVPAGAVAAADIRFDGSVGQREYRPTSVSELPADGYELGAGQLIVDLRDITWKRGRSVPLTSDLGMGRMIVSVPPDVCVDPRADMKAGELLVRGESNAGIDPEFDQGAPAPDARRLDLDAELQLGQLVVTDRDPDEVDDRDHRDGEDPAEAARQREACVR